jgi:hypothetical protein
MSWVDHGHETSFAVQRTLIVLDRSSSSCRMDALRTGIYFRPETNMTREHLVAPRISWEFSLSPKPIGTSTRQTDEIIYNYLPSCISIALVHSGTPPVHFRPSQSKHVEHLFEMAPVSPVSSAVISGATTLIESVPLAFPPSRRFNPTLYDTSTS